VSAAVPLTDDDVPAWWTALDLPGIVDLHVHFMPQRVLDKVWAYFDSAGPLTGRTWPIAYRWPEQQRLSHLRELGVRAFGALVYPHKPAMAAWLNSWAVHFAAAHKDVVHTATFFPEDSAVEYVAKALDDGARMFKAHLQVGGYDPRDPLLDGVWGMLADARVPVIVHAGNGPQPAAFTGPEPFAAVLARHPRLVAVVAHMGMPDYDAFLDLAERHEDVHVDTTMCFTDFHGDQSALARELSPRLATLRDKVVFGSDFPNIPHLYAHQVEALARLDLGDDWLRAVVWDNPQRLLAATG
jgi:uncharacterized protein